MAKFTHGLLFGAATGTLFALFTAKQTGPHLQAALADYLNGLTTATTEVQAAVTRLKQALDGLKDATADDLKTAVAALQAEFADFTFQAEPRLKQINAHVETITTATAAREQTASSPGDD